MSEKLLVSAYLNIGNIWHHDAKVIGTCWGFQLVHNITEQIAMNNPNKSLPMVMLDDANAALAAKDARIAELEQKVIGLEDYVASIPDYRHLCKELRDKLTAQQQAEPCDLVTVPRALFDQAVSWVEDRRRFGDYGTIHSDWLALKAIQRGLPIPAPSEWADAATHSEDGRDNIQVVGKLFRHDFGNAGILFTGDHDMHIKDGDEVMTVAQHERIVAAKDAEIARLNGKVIGLEDYAASIPDYRRLCAELRAQLAAQPARQVGGEEMQALPDGWLIELGFDVLDRQFRFIESKSHTPTIKLILPACEIDDSSAWNLRDDVASRISSALAPAAVVMPERDDYHQIAFEIGGTEDGAYHFEADELDAFVARLNRRAIPEGLIEASRRAADILGSQGFAAWDQLAAELRALLGKGD